MVMIRCRTSRMALEVENTVHMCAERRLIQRMKHRARTIGIRPAAFSHWFNRKVGRLIILRIHCSGTLGTSIPCILCRKALEKYCIDWNAHIGDTWHSNRDECVPVSKFTPKQYGYFYTHF